MHYLVGCVDCCGSEFVDWIYYRTTDVSGVAVDVVGDVNHFAMADMRFRSPANIINCFFFKELRWTGM